MAKARSRLYLRSVQNPTEKSESVLEQPKRSKVRLIGLVGGQPFLVQQALNQLARNDLSLAARHDDAWAELNGNGSHRSNSAFNSRCE
jgi:hypothetical protein